MAAVFSIKKWLGLNQAADGDTGLKNGELSEMKNFRVTREGHMQTRGGTKTVLDLRTAWDAWKAADGNTASTDEPVLHGAWEGQIGASRVLLCAFGGVIFKISISTWTTEAVGVCTQAETTFFGFANKVYLMNGHEYKVWDGTAGVPFSDVTGYIPTVETATPPAGGGTILEAVNRLNGFRRVKFSPDGTSTVFHLPEQSIDEIVSANGTAVTNTANLAEGTVTFSSALPAGTNTLEIVYRKGNGTRSEVIKVWDNRVGRAIKMNGGDVSTVAKIMDPAAISPQISQFIDLAVSYTQKFLGASDVALGDTRPDNTSAIVALQRASAVPSELSRQNLLQAIEDCGRIYLDFMKNYYGKRYVEVDNPMDDTQKQLILFDFSELNDIPLSIKLDAGASSYWSEIATMQTLDNLLMNGKIDTVQYLERLPAGQITDRETLIAVLKAAQAVPPMGGSAAPKDGEIADNGIAPPILGGRGNGTLQRTINQTGEVPK